MKTNKLQRHDASPMLQVAIIMNSFKESLGSMEANEAVHQGLLAAKLPCAVECIPFADGGQGTLEAIIRQESATPRTLQVQDALGMPRQATYYIDTVDGLQSAYMEMAQAAPLCDASRKQPLEASTYGVGEMIADALEQGCRHFVVGIGGSATSDGGKGMLEALGYRFLDANRQPVDKGNRGLGQVAFMDASHVHPALKESTFEIACDVDNPLLYERGAVAIFGPQKGITPDLQPQAQSNMEHWAAMVPAFLDLPEDAHPEETSGAGAAGGLGYAFVTFLQGSLKSGADLVIEHNDILRAISQADLVITGEGAFDDQSLQGKGPGRLIALAQASQKPILVYAGKVDLSTDAALECGASGFFSIVQGPCDLKEALDPATATRNLTQTVFQTGLLIRSLIDDID